MVAQSNRDALTWEKAAPNYIRFIRKEKSSYLKHLIYESLFSEILSFIGDVKGKRVLDAGCGEGRISRILAEKGAEVYSCDVSETMINEAQLIETEKNQGIKYFIHDLTRKMPIDKKFDIIVSNLVLFNIRDYKSAIKNISQAVKSRGRFVFSLLHPCFNSTRSQWFNLRYIKRFGGKIIFNIRKSYKEPNLYKKDYFFKSLKVNYYHRPIDAYFEVLSESGFLVKRLSEPVLKLNEIYDDRTYHHHFLPRFIILEAIKDGLLESES